MSSMLPSSTRVVSGMRATGRLHLGHYHGVLKNWIRLQGQYECFFFVADWHALTTHYEDPGVIAQSVRDMVVDWLAAGVDPQSATLFVQSDVPQHAELHLLLSMITPLGWLERVPTFKDQQEKLRERDLATYGFLGYPLLQSADILAYRAAFVPVGEDQVAHIELCREVARRFNYLYGREAGFLEKAEEALRIMGRKSAKAYKDLREAYLEKGDKGALETARALVERQANMTLGDKERLLGYLEGYGRLILTEPQALLTPQSKIPGVDGQKMAKSYGNVIGLREGPDEVARKIKTMQTDPARKRRTDVGNPDLCPVFRFHEIYSSEDTKAWVRSGCTTASIGCLQCKQPVIEAINAELAPIRERARELEQDNAHVRTILAEGARQAREAADDTLGDVRRAMGLAWE
ncbi:tryptophan--tRNA ligase [Acidiferrobacter sp.]|uniref:tryptophan--tRNA ligase n=1 Tax=Acidiferrobacter sp. TaxID=1872107 RepID=UPI00345B9A35